MFILATPKEYKLVDLTDINLDTFDGITTITAKNNVKPSLEFSAPVDIKETISALIRENKDLKERVLEVDNRFISLFSMVDELYSTLELRDDADILI